MQQNNPLYANPNRVFPDVIGIGCRRSGSSWLHSILNSHSRIGKPENGIHFFSEKHELGIEWYKNQFRGMLQKDVLVDFSISYSYPEYYSSVVEQINDLLPDVKFFIVLRNPIDRAYSDYLRSIRQLEIAKEIPFKEAIVNWPIFLERGLYGQILSKYFDTFKKDRFHVMFYDDLVVDAKKFIENLLDFMGLPPDPEIDYKRIESGGKKIRSENITRLIFKSKTIAEDVFTHMKLIKTWNHITRKFIGPYQWLLGLNEKEEKIDSETQEYLRDYFQNDILILEKLIRRDLRHWLQ